MRQQEAQKKANVILIACILFNLSIGVLYAWSVIKARLTIGINDGGWGWTSSEAGLPYTVAIVTWAIGLLVGGRMQDKIGPRLVVTTGGIMVGLGLVLSGVIGNSVTGITICYGVIMGIGIGFGYGGVTPPALKWFHPSKKGLVSGLIVGGFGLAAAFYAPITNMLLDNFGIEQTMIFLGVAIMIITIPIARLINNPSEGYTPPIPAKMKQSATKHSDAEMTWRQMVKTKRFWLICIMFLFSASVGLMVIGNITKIARAQAGVTDGALLAGLVSFLAVTNSAGRVLGGLVSDKIGRINALFVVFILQALNMLGFAFYRDLTTLILGIIVVGFSYGTLMSVFPSLTADQYGLKHYGLNYGIVYLSWGIAGVVAPVMADYFFDINGNFYITYTICAVMMAAMVVMNYLLKRDIASLKKVA